MDNGIMDPEIMHYTVERVTSPSYGIYGKQVWALQKLTLHSRGSSRFDIDPLKIPQLQSLLKPIKGKHDTDDVFLIVPAAFSVDKMNKIYAMLGGYLAVSEIDVYAIRDAYFVYFNRRDNKIIEYCATLNIKNKVPLYVYKNDAVKNCWILSDGKQLKSDIQKCRVSFLSNYNFADIRNFAEKYISCYHPAMLFSEFHNVSIEDCSGENWLSENKRRETMILYDLFLNLEISGARHLFEEDKPVFIKEISILFGDFLFRMGQEILEVFKERGEGPVQISGFGDPRASKLPKYIKVSEDLIRNCLENPERFVNRY